MPPPDKQVLAYAAGASLCAATLIYVFSPTWTMDSTSDSLSKGHRKKGVVGLANPANDCFINSILQALAGLEDLRAYLIRRTQVAKQRGELTDGGLTPEQRPFLTAALKEILDSLNERPLYRKTITNRPFLIVLERVFRQQISRAQQDAHEFLQVVAETLAEEHNKQKKRVLAKPGPPPPPEMQDRALLDTLDDEGEGGNFVILNGQTEKSLPPTPPEVRAMDVELEFGTMPLEGRLKSEIECQACGFKPKPTVSTFVVLTLPVPQKSSASLAECIDGTLCTEFIDDFQCAKCNLISIISALRQRALQVSPAAAADLANTITNLEHCLATDPEKLPGNFVNDSQPKRSRIAKRTLMETYPDIIALHLSRSIYDTFASRKNSAKVSFPETLHMGGLLDRKGYRLLCVVTHKGGHDSGHYECFRRQIVARAPYSTPSPLPPGSPVQTPSNRSSIKLVPDNSPLSTPASEVPPLTASSASLSPSTITAGSDKKAKAPIGGRKIKRKKGNDRWWRISDDKIKEARTSDVLGMQKEVYLLFYQREKEEDFASHL